jgi:mRNA-degrading endonuclease RelE of RelBE toxin-antitoxin system
VTLHSRSRGPRRQGALGRLPDKIGTQVIEFCYGPLAENPRRVGKSLKLDLAGLLSARRGDFRIIYRIDETHRRVEVVAIDHRADIYRPGARQAACQ